MQRRLRHKFEPMYHNQVCKRQSYGKNITLVLFPDLYLKVVKVTL